MNEEIESSLVERLRNDMGINDSRTVAALIDGFHDAAGYQKQLSDLYDPGITFNEMRQAYDPGITFNEMRQAVESMAGALRKMERGTISPFAVGQLRTALEMVPKPWRDYLGATADEPFNFEATVHALKTKGEIERLQSAVSAFLNDMKAPGRGNARKQAIRYTPGIQMLARHFRSALPDRTVSPNYGTQFYRYVLIWLQVYMREAIKDPKRHIEHALVHEAGWKKLSL